MPGVVIPDAIRYFGARKKIFFAHFRDIRGSVPLFEETFHDEGKTDMVEAMQVAGEIPASGTGQPVQGDALALPFADGAFDRIIAAGRWVDAVRQIIPPDQKLFSWWSYRSPRPPVAGEPAEAAADDAADEAMADAGRVPE